MRRKATTMATEKWLIEDEKVIDFESVRKLKVGLIGGQIDIVGHDEPERPRRSALGARQTAARRDRRRHPRG
jgi:hypothetical protein